MSLRALGVKLTFERRPKHSQALPTVLVTFFQAPNSFQLQPYKVFLLRIRLHCLVEGNSFSPLILYNLGMQL